MLTSRRLWLAGLAAIPFIPRRLGTRAEARRTLDVPEDGLTIDRPMSVQRINGHQFPFIWILKPGDEIRTGSRPNIQAIYVERLRPYGDRPEQYRIAFAWSFHTRPLYTSMPRVAQSNLMDLSFRRGHENWSYV